MSTENKEYQIYLKEPKQWVPVTKEFHDAYFRDIDTYRHQQQKLGRCACTRNKWWLCDMNCEECEFRRAGNQLSLDAEMETDEGVTSLADILPDPDANVEEAVMLMDTLEALNDELDRLDPDSRLFCDLYMDEKSERESAKQLGLSRSTYKRHWEKLKDDLNEKLKEYR